MNLVPLFPHAGLHTNLVKNVPDDVLEKAKDVSSYFTVANSISSNNNVLEELSIKSLLEEKISSYVNEVYKPKNKISVYITESWFSYTKTNEHHHRHSHNNSFLSGVFYVQTLPNDVISFYRPHDTLFNIESKEKNIFNSKDWSFPVNVGDMVLFPSYIEHYVPKNVHNDKVRISLAFNTWISGHINSEKTVSLNV